MKKIKKIIVVSIFAIVIMIVFLIYNLVNINKNIDTEYVEIEDDEQKQDILVDFEKNTVIEDSDYVIFSINDLIQKSLDYISQKNYDAIYNIIDEEYIKKKNININNCKEIFGDNSKNYYIQEVYKIQDSSRTIYYTYGLMLNSQENKIKNFYLKLKVCDDVFSIEPINIEDYDKAKKSEITEFEEFNINKNSYNIFDYKYFTSQEIATRYLKDYMLKKKKKDVDMNIISAKCEVNNDSIEYMVTDIYENNYKIKVYSAMNYEVILEK